MGKAILAMIVTVIVGFMSSAIFANWVNAPEWGIVLAIAVMGGFILGMGEIMLVAFFPSYTGYRDAFAFILLIVILLVKPTGLTGEKIAEKV